MSAAASRREARLRSWGIVEVHPELRGATLEHEVLRETLARVAHVKRRPSFDVECLDCGTSPHVSIDDASIVVCLRCGRDSFL